MSEKRISFRGHAPFYRTAIAPRADERQTIFLLSPANLSGVRGKLLLRDSCKSELSHRLRSSQATLGEVFSFVSGLYFRGKLAYATRFANPPVGLSGIRVITASTGLLTPEHPITVDVLRSMAKSIVHAENPKYRYPLIRDARQLNDSLPADTAVVLLGSIATPKYLEPLLDIFGSRLFFPSDFVGRGDMSRGSLLLRCIREDLQLDYASVGATGLDTLLRRKSDAANKTPDPRR
jgi:hypothetical protein